MKPVIQTNHQTRPANLVNTVQELSTSLQSIPISTQDDRTVRLMTYGLIGAAVVGIFVYHYKETSPKKIIIEILRGSSAHDSSEIGKKRDTIQHKVKEIGANVDLIEANLTEKKAKIFLKKTALFMSGRSETDWKKMSLYLSVPPTIMIIKTKILKMKIKIRIILNTRTKIKLKIPNNTRL